MTEPEPSAPRSSEHPVPPAGGAVAEWRRGRPTGHFADFAPLITGGNLRPQAAQGGEGAGGRGKQRPTEAADLDERLRQVHEQARRAAADLVALRARRFWRRPHRRRDLVERLALLGHAEADLRRRLQHAQEHQYAASTVSSAGKNAEMITVDIEPATSEDALLELFDLDLSDPALHGRTLRWNPNDARWAPVDQGERNPELLTIVGHSADDAYEHTQRH